MEELQKIEEIYADKKEETENIREIQCNEMQKLYDEDIAALVRTWDLRVKQEIEKARQELRRPTQTTQKEVLQYRTEKENYSIYCLEPKPDAPLPCVREPNMTWSVQNDMHLSLGWNKSYMN